MNIRENPAPLTWHSKAFGDVEQYPSTTQGQRQALIFGPVAPEWRGAAFCRPLIAPLTEAGYRVHVVDSIPPLLDVDLTQTDAVLTRYVTLIQDTFGQLDLIGGYAFGGSLALALARDLPTVRDVLCLSGPAFADAQLSENLGQIVALLRQGDLAGSLQLLSQVVAPLGAIPNATHIDVFTAEDANLPLRRMQAGFEFLIRLDARPLLQGFNGRVLALTGQKSQLATNHTLGFGTSQSDRFTHFEVSNAGMRVLFDNPTASLAAIQEWLEND